MLCTDVKSVFHDAHLLPQVRIQGARGMPDDWCPGAVVSVEARRRAPGESELSRGSSSSIGAARVDWGRAHLPFRVFFTISGVPSEDTHFQHPEPPKNHIFEFFFATFGPRSRPESGSRAHSPRSISIRQHDDGDLRS